MNEQQLIITPFYTALARPAMLLGVDLRYVAIVGMLSLCVFIVSDSILYLLSYIPLHILGYILCQLDVNIFSILSKKLECLPVANYKIWGCNSYAPN